MKNYNVFDEAIPQKFKESYEIDLIQTKAMLDVSNLITEALEEKGITRSELAQLMGVSRGYITKVLSGNENLSVQNVAKILYYLDKDYNQTLSQRHVKDETCVLYYFEDYVKNSIPIKDCHASISQGNSINWKEVSNG